MWVVSLDCVSQYTVAIKNSSTALTICSIYKQCAEYFAQKYFHIKIFFWVNVLSKFLGLKIPPMIFTTSNATNISYYLVRSGKKKRIRNVGYKLLSTFRRFSSIKAQSLRVFCYVTSRHIKRLLRAQLSYYSIIIWLFSCW